MIKVFNFDSWYIPTYTTLNLTNFYINRNHLNGRRNSSTDFDENIRCDNANTFLGKIELPIWIDPLSFSLNDLSMDSLAMAHSSWNDEDYDNHFWPMLRETVDILMLKSSYEPFSYEKVTFSS